MSVARVRRLGRSLLVNFTLVAVLPLVAVSCLVLYHLTAETQQGIAEKNLLLARAVSGQVEVFLREPLTVLRNVRGLLLASAELPDAQVRLLLDTHVRNSDYFESIFLLGAEGKVASVGLPVEAEGLRADFLGVDLSHQEFYRQALRSRTPTWSDTFLSLTSGKMSLALCLAVDDRVLVGNFNVDLLAGFTRKINVGDRVIISLVDRGGAIIVHPDPALVARQVNVHNLPPVAMGFAGQEGTSRYWFDGIEYLGSDAVVPGAGWVAVVSQTTTDAFSGIWNAARIFVVGAVAAALLAVLFAVAKARRLARPLSEFAAEARAVAEGGYDLSPAAHEFAEVQDLAASLRRMADSVRDRERRLRDSRERYILLFNRTNDAIMVHQLDERNRATRFIEVNDVACALLGYAREELLGMGPLDIVAGDGKSLLAELSAVLQRQGHFLRELSLRRRDGGSVPTEAHAHLFEMDGVLTVLSVLRDVSERKAAQWALAESERKFRRLVESAHAVPWEFDPLSGRFTYMGPQMTKLLGYPAASWTDLEVWKSRIPEEDRPTAAALCARAVETGRELEFQHRFVGQDGQVCWVHEVVATAGQVGDRQPLVVGLTLDITELKRVERERQELEERLSHSQRMEAVGTLAGGVAHDFNNILHAISGYARLALGNLEGGNSNRHHLEQIEIAAERAAGLVRNLLAFSRRSRPERQVLDLNQEVRHTIGLLERTIPKMVQIHACLGEGPYPVKADATQLSQVLMNLGTNARDAMPQGGTLSVTTESMRLAPGDPRLEADALPGEYVLLRVADTGHGMEADTLKLIFNPFFTTKELGEGTGLGLSTVWGIVKEHGGWVHCRSAPGRGATFEIYLPAAEAAEPSREAVERTAAEPGKGGGETILLVDDEATVLELGKVALEAEGYTVHTAPNGEEALASYRGRPAGIDLVILDLGMPGMGGHRCLEELRRINPAVKVVIASGYSSQQQRDRVERAGVEAFLGKPYRLGDLAKTVRQVLDST